MNKFEALGRLLRKAVDALGKIFSFIKPTDTFTTIIWAITSILNLIVAIKTIIKLIRAYKKSKKDKNFVEFVLAGKDSREKCDPQAKAEYQHEVKKTAKNLVNNTKKNKKDNKKSKKNDLQTLREAIAEFEKETSGNFRMRSLKDPCFMDDISDGGALNAFFKHHPDIAKQYNIG